MGSCHNPNAPSKGTNVTVEPIRDLDAIRTITENLKSHPRNFLLFVLGINNGLRVVDLLNLKVKQVRDARVGEIVRIKRIKDGKAEYSRDQWPCPQGPSGLFAIWRNIQERIICSSLQEGRGL